MYNCPRLVVIPELKSRGNSLKVFSRCSSKDALHQERTFAIKNVGKYYHQFIVAHLVLWLLLMPACLEHRVVVTNWLEILILRSSDTPEYPNSCIWALYCDPSVKTRTSLGYSILGHLYFVYPIENVLMPLPASWWTVEAGVSPASVRRLQLELSSCSPSSSCMFGVVLACRR